MSPRGGFSTQVYMNPAPRAFFLHSSPDLTPHLSLSIYPMASASTTRSLADLHDDPKPLPLPYHQHVLSITSETHLMIYFRHSPPLPRAFKHFAAARHLQRFHSFKTPSSCQFDFPFHDRPVSRNYATLSGSLPFLCPRPTLKLCWDELTFRATPPDRSQNPPEIVEPTQLPVRVRRRAKLRQAGILTCSGHNLLAFNALSDRSSSSSHSKFTLSALHLRLTRLETESELVCAFDG
ncbi:hypothetical protein DFH09DRAFT_1464393 [Mycena vulgaris]|nr:hypothetical protein DFH09DRAFT_1464393 [Mycena vulgaris]